MRTRYKILTIFLFLLLILIYLSGYYSAINADNWISGDCERFLYSDLNKKDDPWEKQRDLECHFFKCESGNLGFHKDYSISTDLNGIEKIKVFGFFAYIFGKVGSCQAAIGDMSRQPILFKLEEERS